MLLNTLLLALRAIRRNLLRSFLTILGIVIGVSAVITMVTLGNGATQAVQNQISSLGSNLLMVRPGQRQGPGGAGGAPSFKEADADAIAAQIGGVAAVAPEARDQRHRRRQRPQLVDQRHRHHQRLVRDQQLEARLRAACSRTPRNAPAPRSASSARRCGASCSAARGSAARRAVAHQAVLLRGHRRAASKGQAAMGNDQDDTVLVPLQTLQRRVTGNQRRRHAAGVDAGRQRQRAA